MNYMRKILGSSSGSFASSSIDDPGTAQGAGQDTSTAGNEFALHSFSAIIHSYTLHFFLWTISRSDFPLSSGTIPKLAHATLYITDCTFLFDRWHDCGWLWRWRSCFRALSCGPGAAARADTPQQTLRRVSEEARLLLKVRQQCIGQWRGRGSAVRHATTFLQSL